jgi:hypothetical protein
MIEHLEAVWRHNDKLYVFHGVKPTIYEAFEGLNYSTVDSKILTEYCACLFCNELINYAMVVYNIFDDYLIKNIIENNKYIIFKKPGQIIYLINR